MTRVDSCSSSQVPFSGIISTKNDDAISPNINSDSAPVTTCFPQVSCSQEQNSLLNSTLSISVPLTTSGADSPRRTSGRLAAKAAIGKLASGAKAPVSQGKPSEPLMVAERTDLDYDSYAMEAEEAEYPYDED